MSLSEREIKQWKQLGLDTQLITCVDEHKPERVAGLIAQGANPNAPAADMFPVIFAAAARGDKACITALIEAGANVNAPGLDFSRPVHEAAYFGEIETVLFLISKGADPLAMTEEAETIICIARCNKKKNPRAAQKLVEGLSTKTLRGLRERICDAEDISPSAVLNHKSLELINKELLRRVKRREEIKTLRASGAELEP